MTARDNILRWLQTEAVEICIFDFGGTLFDFTPVHIRAFQVALMTTGIDLPTQRLADTVRRCLHIGMDSFYIADHLVKMAAIDRSPSQVAMSKRHVVENLILEAKLEDWVVALLTELVGSYIVSVITRGMANSTQKILMESLDPQSASQIKVWGRHSEEEAVIKEDLLRASVRDLCERNRHVGYVGDSMEDESIANSVGIPFLRFAPFD